MKNIYFSFPPIPVSLLMEIRNMSVDYSVGLPRVYPHFSIIFVLKGILHIENGEKYTVEENEFILLPPIGEIVIIHKGTNCEGFCMDFSFDGNWEIIEGEDILDVLKKDIEPNNFTIPKKALIIPIRGKGSNILIKDFKENLDFFENQEFLINILNGIRMQHNNPLTNASIVLAMKINEIINSRFTKITVKDISRVLNYNVNYIERCFKKYYGKSIKTYIIELKMRYAKKMLKTQNVTTVARILNYSNTSSFSRQYKDFFGKSPSSVMLKNNGK